MRDRLIYILKHNDFIQKLYKVIMSAVFRLFGSFIKIDDHLILVVSMMGKSFGDSPKVLYDHIRSQEKYKQYHFIWAFEHPEKFPQVQTVKIDTLSYFFTALKAKYWLTNTNIERGLRFKKKNQIYMNTWHGTPIKKIGNDCPGRNDFNFDTVDYLIVSGKFEEKIFKSAFRAKESSYLKCGMPRNEELWKVTDVDKLAMRRKLHLSSDKKIILYAPTWRESTDGGKSYSIKPPIHFDEWEKQLGADYIVLFRAHHLTTKILGVKYNDFIQNVSDYPSVNDLMIAADILITDYSAIAHDFSILCKPILTFAYDYDTFLAERGMYFDMDKEYPNPSCRTEQELFQRIQNLDYEVECKNTTEFKEKFMQYGGNATECCVESLLG